MRGTRTHVNRLRRSKNTLASVSTSRNRQKNMRCGSSRAPGTRVYRTEQDKEDRKERVVVEAEPSDRNFDRKCFRQHIWTSAAVTQPCVCHA